MTRRKRNLIEELEKLSNKHYGLHLTEDAKDFNWDQSVSAYHFDLYLDLKTLVERLEND